MVLRIKDTTTQGCNVWGCYHELITFGDWACFDFPEHAFLLFFTKISITSHHHENEKLHMYSETLVSLLP